MGIESWSAPKNESEGQMVVGVQKSPDGTLDYSKAATMVEKNRSFKLDDFVGVAKRFKEINVEGTQKASSEVLRKSSQKVVNRFEGVLDILESLKQHNLATTDDVLGLLQKKVEEMELARETEKDDEEFDQLTADIEKTENTIEFIRTTNETQIKTAQEWQSKKEQEVVQTRLSRDKHETSEKLDATQEKKVIAEILEQGGVVAFLSLPAMYSQDGHHGFSALVDSKRTNFEKLEIRRASMRFKTHEDELKKQVIHELVAIEPLEIEKRISVPEERRKWYGAKEIVMKNEWQTTKPRHDEIVAGGKQEETYVFTYKTLDGDKNPAYRDYSHRHGQLLVIEIALPKSEALTIQSKIEANPSLVRELIDQAMIGKFGLDKSAWFNGNKTTNGIALRPPYDEWAKQNSGKSKMYIEGINGSKIVEF